MSSREGGREGERTPYRLSLYWQVGREGEREDIGGVYRPRLHREGGS